MNKIEVIQTLRLYDADFIAKLGTLMQREEKKFGSKNDFMTELLMLGYKSYIARQTGGAETGAAFGADSAVCDTINAISTDIKEIAAHLKELSEYIILQFQILNLYHGIYQKLLSANYRMLLSLIGGEKVISAKIEDGFFDDLPARFEKIAAELKEKSGVS